MTSYALERRIAELAVRRASILTDRVFHGRVKGTVTKIDKSPVTLADYAAQSLIIGAVLHAFPSDSVVGEEDAEELRRNEELRGLVWKYIKETLNESEESSKGIGTIRDEAEMLDFIDVGTHNGGASGRIWALDPIDGTKGFLRGDQYAVCLGLMVDGKVVVGAIGCPNLPVDPSNPDGEKGIVVSAAKGAGATIKPLSKIDGEGQRISMNQPTSCADAAFCEGVEAGHSSHGQQAAIAAALGVAKPSVRMDSQAKYASISRADGDVYLRLPTSATYEEKIWDHAAGSLIVEEAGGTISDTKGQPLDFSIGRTLKNNKGIVAAPKSLHPRVIEAVKAELSKSSL